MLLYLDSSALVKRYVDEPMSEAVRALMDEAPAAATALITHTEVGAALARAMRDGRLEEEDARRAHEEFLQEWPDLGRVPITQALVTRADKLAWAHGLRAYDAVQLAAALTCQDTVAALGYDVMIACCDKKLLQVAATNTGLRTWPEQTPAGR